MGFSLTAAAVYLKVSRARRGQNKFLQSSPKLAATGDAVRSINYYYYINYYSKNWI